MSGHINNMVGRGHVFLEGVKTRRVVLRRKAQAIVELVVFGAVFIFILGLILKQSMSMHYIQKEDLKVMRMALAASFGSYALKNAPVIIIEDRLSPDSFKYGSQGRIPIIKQASAMWTNNLYMPGTYGVDEELPSILFYINGSHFTLTLAGYKSVAVRDGDAFKQEVFENDEGGLDRGMHGGRDCGGHTCVWGWEPVPVRSIDPSEDGNYNNVVVDVDGDLREEHVFNIGFSNDHRCGEIMLEANVDVMDYQDGDIDGSLSSLDGQLQQGLLADAAISTNMTGVLSKYSPGGHSTLEGEMISTITRYVRLNPNRVSGPGSVSGMLDFCEGCRVAVNPVNPETGEVIQGDILIIESEISNEISNSMRASMDNYVDINVPGE